MRMGNLLVGNRFLKRRALEVFLGPLGDSCKLHDIRYVGGRFEMNLIRDKMKFRNRLRWGFIKMGERNVGAYIFLVIVVDRKVLTRSDQGNALLAPARETSNL